MVTTKKQLAPTRPMVNGYGYGNKKKFLTIHQTGNTNKGANAQMHANLQSGVYGASWHWQVDDKEAIQSFDHTYRCWHASDGRGDGNSNSIAIEGCINSDGNYIQSVKNMAELAAKILKDEGIPIENMRQHHDFDTKNRKDCPAQIRAGKDGINWNKFVQMVKGFMNGSTITKPSVVPSKVSGKTVKVGKQATHWQNGASIPSFVKGQTYDVIEEKNVNQSNSKKAFLIGKGKAVTGWLLEQDVEGFKATTAPITTAPSESATKSIDTLVAETLKGIHGDGDARKKSLGSNYDAVMKVINGGANSAPTPVANKKRVYLPKSAKTWRVYRTSGPYTTGKEVGFLAPAQYGGLDYEIIKTLATDVYQIKTSTFGNVAIYAAISTGATIK